MLFLFLNIIFKKDKMIIDILDESKKRVYDHYLEYVDSDRTTVFKEDRHK